MLLVWCHLRRLAVWRAGHFLKQPLSLHFILHNGKRMYLHIISIFNDALILLGDGKTQVS